MTVSRSLLDAINALPNKKWVKHQWTKEEDEALLAGWGTKNHDAVAKVIGLSIETCRLRYRELTNV